MRLWRFLLMILGAIIGTLLIIWVIRTRRIILMPGDDGRDWYHRHYHNWIELK